METALESRAVIEECVNRSHEGTIDFATVVSKLISVGVESYYTDYRRQEHVYYLSSGETHSMQLSTPELSIADQFEAKDVREAVLGSQRGEIKYPEFVRRTMSAGCVGYFVWITGRQVQYFGRRGEIHVEHFPKN
jgi:uncharacterized protein YbcV (DUF1398 family)